MNEEISQYMASPSMAELLKKLDDETLRFPYIL